MKLLSLLVLLFSFSSFAQDITWTGADYGVFEEEFPKCSQEACIDLDGSEYGFYEFQDIDGYSSMQLNTESSLMDMNLDRACFRGEAKEVLEIIEALAGNTNTYYSQGGHVSVVGINAKTLTKSKIVIDITFITDYDYETQSFSQTMKVCE
tara:strand:+ start:193 stop:645 length:453 start_codon:yes stop_codon:yes gene_type:complete